MRTFLLFSLLLLASVAFSQEPSFSAPAYPERKWLVSYEIESGWGSVSQVGVTVVSSQFGNPGMGTSLLHKDLLVTLAKAGLLDGVNGLGQYREKNGKKTYRANVYLLNYNSYVTGFVYEL